MKADAERAKQASLLGEEYKPAIPGIGAAWSHNFLNQKPWHPLNFRNQMKVYEAQQQAEAEAKAKAQAKVGHVLVSWLAHAARCPLHAPCVNSILPLN
jgi:hypothetical protein